VTLAPDHVAISVPDLDAARDWYAGAFGLAAGPVVAIGGAGVTGTVLRHASGFRIELLHRPEATAGPIETGGPDEATLTLGYGHLCWRSDDVTADHDRLVAAGAVSRIAPRPSPQRPGATICFLTDPWGNLLEILDRPDERP
jgi:catechol 2,3-dioxygenase-like lactoylglutathione lyase family enzyme